MSGARVVSTLGAIYGVVTARQRHRCQGRLTRHHIEPGQKYVASALPPRHPEIGNIGWWHARYCLDCCPIEFDTRELAR